MRKKNIATIIFVSLALFFHPSFSCDLRLNVDRAEEEVSRLNQEITETLLEAEETPYKILLPSDSITVFYGTKFIIPSISNFGLIKDRMESYGHHTVYLMDKVYYKRSPNEDPKEARLNPFMDNAFYRYASIVFGHSDFFHPVPHTYLIVRSEEKKTKDELILASREVPGENFSHAISRKKNGLTDQWRTMDPQSYQALMILSLITGASDLKPDNLILMPKKTKGYLFQLVGIDMDQCFCPTLIDRQMDHSLKQNMEFLEVYTRNFFYFPHFFRHTRFSQELEKEIKKIPIDFLYLEWLSATISFQRQSDDLLGHPDFQRIRQKSFANAFWAEPLRRSFCISGLMQKMSFAERSFGDLFQQFYPLIASFYDGFSHDYFKKYGVKKSEKSRIDAFWGLYNTEEGMEPFRILSVLPMESLLTDGRTCVEVLSTEIKQSKLLSPMDMAQEFFGSNHGIWEGMQSYCPTPGAARLLCSLHNLSDDCLSWRMLLSKYAQNTQHTSELKTYFPPPYEKFPFPSSGKSDPLYLLEPTFSSQETFYDMAARLLSYQWMGRFGSRVLPTMSDEPGTMRWLVYFPKEVDTQAFSLEYLKKNSGSFKQLAFDLFSQQLMVAMVLSPEKKVLPSSFMDDFRLSTLKKGGSEGFFPFRAFFLEKPKGHPMPKSRMKGYEKFYKKLLSKGVSTKAMAKALFLPGEGDHFWKNFEKTLRQDATMFFKEEEINSFMEGTAHLWAPRFHRLQEVLRNLFFSSKLPTHGKIWSYIDKPKQKIPTVDLIFGPQTLSRSPLFNHYTHALHLSSIDLSDFLMNDNLATHLLQKINTLHTLEKLILNNNSLSDVTAKRLGTMLSNRNTLYFPSLRQVSMNHNLVRDDGALNLLRAFMVSKNQSQRPLLALNLDFNPISVEMKEEIKAFMTEAVIEAFLTNQNNEGWEIQSFYDSCTAQLSKPVAEVCQEISKRKVVSRIDLPFTPLKPMDLVALKVLSTDCFFNISSLDLSHGSLLLDPTGLGVANLLKNIPYLRSLYLSDNAFSDQACEKISHALSGIDNLRVLGLSSLHTSPKGFQILMTALEKIPCLTRLSLALNHLQNEDLQEVTFPASLQTLDLRYNRLTPRFLKKMVELIQKPESQFQRVILDHNHISPEFSQKKLALAFIDKAKNGQNMLFLRLLENFGMSSNFIGVLEDLLLQDEDIRHIEPLSNLEKYCFIHGLKYNHSLRSLKLNMRTVSAIDLRHMFDGLKETPLRYLGLLHLNSFEKEFWHHLFHFIASQKKLKTLILTGRGYRSRQEGLIGSLSSLGRLERLDLDIRHDASSNALWEKVFSSNDKLFQFRCGDKDVPLFFQELAKENLSRYQGKILRKLRLTHTAFSIEDLFQLLIRCGIKKQFIEDGFDLSKGTVRQVLTHHHVKNTILQLVQLTTLERFEKKFFPGADFFNERYGIKEEKLDALREKSNILLGLLGQPVMDPYSFLKFPTEEFILQLQREGLDLMLPGNKVKGKKCRDLSGFLTLLETLNSSHLSSYLIARWQHAMGESFKGFEPNGIFRKEMERYPQGAWYLQDFHDDQERINFLKEISDTRDLDSYHKRKINHFLGRSFEKGVLGEKNRDDSRRYYQRASEAGCPLSAFKLYLLSSNPEEKLHYLHHAAALGHVTAAFDLCAHLQEEKEKEKWSTFAFTHGFVER